MVKWPFDIRYVPNLDPQLVTSKLVRNANYNHEHVSLNGWCRTPLLVDRKDKPLFFEALRKNVAEHGFRNPIVVYSLPEGLILSFGGSRLYVAKELGVLIPAIVVDYTGQFRYWAEVTQDNWQDCFTDVPVYFEFTDDGVDTHYSLERNRRSTYDEGGMAWAPKESEFVAKEFGWIQKP